MIEIYQVHAFTAHPHGGSPAGVCVYTAPLAEAAMRAIAMDLGPSVTAFVREVSADLLDLRWFTRMGEEVVTFCGHATFAAAHIMLRHKQGHANGLVFSTISGFRKVSVTEDGLEMAAPRWPPEPATCPDLLLRAIGDAPDLYFEGRRDRLLIYENFDRLMALRPDYGTMLGLGVTGVIATSPRGSDSFAFRFFCPGFRIGEDEDPATGSALSTLGPYWAARLGRAELTATQHSERGAHFKCWDAGDSILVRSTCATFLAGQLAFNPDLLFAP